MPIHAAARDGFTARAATYVTGRPDYPAAVREWLDGDVGLAPKRVVLDLGAGTGKFVPWLRATGVRIVAVEPVAAMRAELVAHYPDVQVHAGSAERIPLGDASLDAVVCAQAFHWFANRDALAEIRRVLRPGGVLGLIWNVRDESVPWVAALTRIMAPYEGGTPRMSSSAWRALFPAAGFGRLRERCFANAHVGPPEQVLVDRILSVSFIGALPEPVQEEVATAIRALIAATPELAGRDEVSFPYETLAAACTREG